MFTEALGEEVEVELLQAIAWGDERRHFVRPRREMDMSPADG